VSIATFPAIMIYEQEISQLKPKQSKHATLLLKLYILEKVFEVVLNLM
jgi:hypothetical protein